LLDKTQVTKLEPSKQEVNPNNIANSVCTTNKKHFTITKINWLTLLRKIITVYSEMIQNTDSP
jgi:hypothetical protein